MVNLHPDNHMALDEIRAHVCYDWKDRSDLLIGNDGEWYLGGRDSNNHRDGWVNVKCVSNILHILDQKRVRIMQRHGQVDNHIKAMEARKDFQWCVDEIADEAAWAAGSRNFGYAKNLKAMADRCRPLIDHVWSRDWVEAREMMSEVLSRMEP